MLEDLIACPNPDHGRLRVDGNGYVCEACGAHFEIRDGIPVLLPKGE